MVKGSLVIEHKCRFYGNLKMNDVKCTEKGNDEIMHEYVSNYYIEIFYNKYIV